MIDLHTPQFSGAQAARACKVPAATLRTYFARGHFRILGSMNAKQREANGLPNLFSLRDVIGLAVSFRLLQTTPLSPASAFEIGMIHFAHTGSDMREPGLPFNVRQHGKTLVIVYPDTGKHRIVQGNRCETLALAGLTTANPAICVLAVNDTVADVFAALGLNRQDGYIGSPESVDGDDEMGEIVSE